MKHLISLFALSLAPMALAAAEEPKPAIIPDATYMFAQRDTCDLFMDIYEPAKGSETTFEGREKPAILFMFGGGFIEGTRDNMFYLPWYKELTEKGYRVIAIDYRLGLKGSTSVGIAQTNLLDKAIHMAVEDLFSATRYIIDNKASLGIDPGNIVLCGSSAGAISILQAEYELCNRTSYAEILPADFRYAGLMPYSGAVFSRKGKLKFASKPSPIMLMHGTADELVPYKQIAFFNLGFFGTNAIVKRFQKFGIPYYCFRYVDHQHEIASIMGKTVDYQVRFIREEVMRKKGRTIDAYVIDPEIEHGSGAQSRKDLYGK